VDTQRGISAVLDQGIVSGLSFATCSIVAIACGRFELGVAHLVLTILVLAMNVQGELVNAPFTVYRPRRRPSDRPAYTGSMFVHQASLAALSLLCVSGYLIVLVCGIGPAHMITPLFMLLLAMPFCLMHAFLRHVAFACFQFRVALAMDIAVTWIQLSSILVLFFTGTLTVSSIFIVMGVASAIVCVSWYLLRPEPFHVIWRQSWLDWCTNWLFGRWAMLSHAVGCAMTYVLPWLLVAMHDEAATGTLAACGKISALAGTFVVGVAHYLTPRAVESYARDGLPGLHRVLGATVGVFVAAVGAFCVLIFATGDTLLTALFGDEFAGAGAIVSVLSVAVLLNSLAVVAGNALWAIDRPQANLFGDIAALVATLAAAVGLVASWGALGAAVAILVGGGVGAIVRGMTFWILSQRVASTAEVA
jgi:O-antigen/teichoic acid export membrane protein